MNIPNNILKQQAIFVIFISVAPSHHIVRGTLGPTMHQVNSRERIYLKGMVKSRVLFLFLAGATTWVLSHLDIHQERLALSRWSAQLSADSSLRQTVENHCSIIVGEEQSDLEATFLRTLGPSRQIFPIKRCLLKVAAESRSKLLVLSQWVFTISLVSNDNFEFQKSFPVRFPLPFALLPLVLWGLAIVFNYRGLWQSSLWIAIFISLFLVSGLSPQEVSRTALGCLTRLAITEKNFISLCALLFWALLMGHHRSEPNTQWPRWVGRIFGIWNPASLASLFPLQYVRTHLFSSLSEQAICVCLSAYFLVPDWESWDRILLNIRLPRYFTVALVFWLVLKRVRDRPPPRLIHRGCLVRSVATVTGVELLAQAVPWLQEIGFTLRMSLAINAGLLIMPRQFEWRKVFKDCLILKWPCLGLFVSTFIVTSGTAELVLETLNPIYHPNAATVLTFVAGIAMGLITGSFSFSYFSLWPLLSKFQAIGLIQASLVDGIAAGTLLSPFHPLTLMTAGFFKTKFQDAYEARLRLFLPPILLSGFIYGLGTLQLFSILLPITFVFLCLVIGALYLRAHRWSLGY